MYLKAVMHTFVILFIALHAGLAASQSTETTTNDRGTQLEVVQSVLEAKLLARAQLRDKVVTSLPADVAELENNLKRINAEIVELRNSFEQIAVGSVDLGLFDNESANFDIQSEMTQVMMPIVRNLQSLTEKPRKIEAHRIKIERTKAQLAATNRALSSITHSISLSSDEPTKNALQKLQINWTDRAQELERKRDVAIVQLANLQKSDGNFWDNFKAGIINFVTGRGLTIVLAVASAFLVWLTAKLLSRIMLSVSRREGVKSYRTRQRLVQYGFNILTVLAMVIAVIVVFYVRGDVLLLGIAFLFATVAIVGLRHTVPRFISEARLLLNFGSVREDERVIYNGLPFQVVSLNMFSVLRNPELSGVIRLPLSSMLNLISRPAGEEIWFPASKGDYILLTDGKLLKVTELTTELIHLQNLTGTKTTIPAADFYNMTFENLSQGEAFAITSTFGIGYSHQAISTSSIPETIQKAISKALSETSFSEHVESVAVELKEAGASSLDYWVCVTLSSQAARSYYKVSRIVQQTCVDTCTIEKWDIPFPQLTIHQHSAHSTSG